MQSLSKEERLIKIVEQVTAAGKLDMRSLSDALDVSVDTIRRDIKELHDQGMLRAIRGGAIAHSPIPLPFRERVVYDTEEKKLIAKKAITLLQDDQVIILDSGTSALAVAKNIPLGLKLTVITNSFAIVNALQNNCDIAIIFAGGRLSRTGYTTIGPETIRAFGNIRADLCFISVYSIHAGVGVTSAQYEDAELKKILVDNSRRVVALATANKTNTAEAFFVCPIAALDMLITDIDPNNEQLSIFGDAGLKIL